MPELPEVETVRVGLESEITGHQITAVVSGDFPGVMGEAGIATSALRITGQIIDRVDRRGKYLILRFIGGNGLIIHLRMTGVLSVSPASAPPPRFLRLTMVLEDERELRFSDQRKFGRVLAASDADISALDHRLGPEPLDASFIPETLVKAFRNRRAPVKSLLLDQTVIAGLGNIYVDEALFRAKVHPRSPAGALQPDQLSALHDAIQTVLADGIRFRGTSFSSFRNAYGEPGENQRHLAVYGRTGPGSLCHVCGTPLQRIVVSGRGTHFCPICQPAF